MWSGKYVGVQRYKHLADVDLLLSATALQHLSELRPAPSVGLQDVPRESVGEHLGIASVYEQTPLDDLDEQLARELGPHHFVAGSLSHLPSTYAEHTRFVYHLQETLAPQSDSESDEEDDEPDAFAPRARSHPARVRGGKTRMSLLTGELFDVPRLEERDNGYYDLGCGHEPWAGDTPARGARRHFFRGASRWDAALQQVLLERERAGVVSGAADIGALMMDGGREDGQTSPEAGEEMDVDPEDI